MAEHLRILPDIYTEELRLYFYAVIFNPNENKTICEETAAAQEHMTCVTAAQGLLQL